MSSPVMDDPFILKLETGAIYEGDIQAGIRHGKGK